ncbi:MAG: hypothetical protein IKP32_09000 [Clostridia bacterium]|nr:hypothetical protein [Clostridia bacterium]
MKRLFALLLCCVTLLSALPAALAEDADYAAAFTQGKTLTLEKTALPAIGLLYGWMPISLSPDGKTMLWTDHSKLYMTRDGLVIPAKIAPDRGVGDPYENLEKDFMRVCHSLPGQEGVNWSPDSRYALLTNKSMSMKNARNLDLIVLDAETGDVFLAVALAPKPMEEGFGFVYEAKFDRTGQYIYFTGRLSEFDSGGWNEALYRCDLTTFEVQVVCQNMFMIVTPGLFEKADGNWLVLGMKSRNGKDPDTVYVCGPAGVGKDALAIYAALTGSSMPVGSPRVYSGVLSYSMLHTGCMSYSSQTGYGVMLGSTAAVLSGNGVNTDIPEDTLKAVHALLQAVNLRQITPEGPDMTHYWRFQDDAGDLSDVRLELVEDSAITALKNSDLETAAAYGKALADNPPPVSTCCCMSPDGRFALINVGSMKQCRFFLLDVAQMELRPVEAPEGLPTIVYGSPLAAKYYPGMVWSEDGTLLIFNTETSTVEAYRLTVR